MGSSLAPCILEAKQVPPQYDTVEGARTQSPLSLSAMQGGEVNMIFYLDSASLL